MTKTKEEQQQKIVLLGIGLRVLRLMMRFSNH